MFILKGLVSFFLMPLSIFILLVLLAMYFYYKKREQKAKKFFIASFVWIFLLSYQPLNVWLLSFLENQYEKVALVSSEAKYILALGGDTLGRTYEVLRLYHMQKGLKIITSGFEPHGSNGAIHTARILNESGIEDKDIEVRLESKDTLEEAKMLKEKGIDGAFYLVTSAYHMPRSIAIFKKIGLHPIAAPTNFLQSKALWHKVFNTKALFQNEIVFHELIGLAWYKFKGYI